jgi:hypothetical protein
MENIKPSPVNKLVVFVSTDHWRAGFLLIADAPGIKIKKAPGCPGLSIWCHSVPAFLQAILVMWMEDQNDNIFLQSRNPKLVYFLTVP